MREESISIRVENKCLPVLRTSGTTVAMSSAAAAVAIGRGGRKEGGEDFGLGRRDDFFLLHALVGGRRRR